MLFHKVVDLFAMSQMLPNAFFMTKKIDSLLIIIIHDEHSIVVNKIAMNTLSPLLLTIYDGNISVANRLQL